jgi:hypothetical protein
MAVIADLDPVQLARHATNTFIYWGRQELGTRLAYHSLSLDPRQPEAMARLSDCLDIPGSQPLSATVLEYGVSQESGLLPEGKALLEELRFHALWSWGVSRHRSGRTELAYHEFADRSQFVIADTAHRALLDSVLSKAGTLRAGFLAAHTFSGVISGLLTHRELGAKAGLGEIYYADRFVKTPQYAVWLSSSTRELEVLEQERQRASLKGLDKKPKSWWQFWKQ